MASDDAGTVTGPSSERCQARGPHDEQCYREAGHPGLHFPERTTKDQYVTHPWGGDYSFLEKYPRGVGDGSVPKQPYYDNAVAPEEPEDYPKPEKPSVISSWETLMVLEKDISEWNDPSKRLVAEALVEALRRAWNERERARLDMIEIRHRLRLLANQ